MQMIFLIFFLLKEVDLFDITNSFDFSSFGRLIFFP
jgi:hypothetical protein